MNFKVPAKLSALKDWVQSRAAGKPAPWQPRDTNALIFVGMLAACGASVPIGKEHAAAQYRDMTLSVARVVDGKTGRPLSKPVQPEPLARATDCVDNTLPASLVEPPATNVRVRYSMMMGWQIGGQSREELRDAQTCRKAVWTLVRGRNEELLVRLASQGDAMGLAQLPSRSAAAMRCSLKCDDRYPE